MAIDNLNYYSAWLPAGQQTDRYSSQPGCLRSKNLDIFSSSKSVKATAWSEPTNIDSTWIIAQDDRWWLQLRDDWKVWDSRTDTLIVDPSVNFPSYKISYTWEDWPYDDAQRWTPVDMMVKYEWDTRKTIIVYTDRASFTYLSEKITLDKEFWTISGLTKDSERYANWYRFTKPGSATTTTVDIKIPEWKLTNVKLKILADQYDSSSSDIELTKITFYAPKWYYYDAELDSIAVTRLIKSSEMTTFSGSIRDEWWLTLELPDFPVYSSSRRWCTLTFSYTPKNSSYQWSGELFIDMNDADDEEAIDGWDTNYYYSYLPLWYREKQEVWEYYWQKSLTFQILYQRVSYWIKRDWQKVAIYDFEKYMWWANDPNMDVIWMIVWNEQVYMIGNMNWNWYIIPCDLAWGRWTPYIAYGCTFRWVTNIDYLMYLVWEDRGISCLWVYNWQELVPVIWGREEKDSKNLIKNEEQYKFDWKIVNWRKNLILTTEDNRIFQYWQTYGGKGWVFIHELPSEATITWLKTSWNDLEVDYSITVNDTTTNYSIKYQDDTPIKNYNLEWMAEYPIVIWNHLLEKEESDLYASYILPSSACKLEFWGMANHYHFWTFKTDWLTTPTAWSKWYIDGSTWSYWFEFIEKNEEYLTMKLVGNLPVMTGSETLRLREPLLPPWQSFTYIGYSEFNHFRKIWEITTTEYKEWEFRFHNLNNKLELPKSHSLQIMVKGKGNQNYTPELFALDLVANQRERW